MKSSSPNQLIAHVIFSLYFISCLHSLTNFMFLRNLQYQIQARIQSFGNCTCKKGFLVDEDDHQHPLAGSQDFYEMGFCVQVVPSGRASSNSNQWEKKKKETPLPRLSISNLILVNNFPIKKTFYRTCWSHYCNIVNLRFLACSLSSELFFSSIYENL